MIVTTAPASPLATAPPAPPAPSAPAELVEAVLAYEAAVVADDVAALGRAFAPGPATVRVDGDATLRGHEAIERFRSARGGVRARRIVRLDLRPVGEHAWLVHAEHRYDGGGRGAFTQVWSLGAEGWQVLGAHVTAPAPALDRSIWRVVGDPLVAGASDGPLRGLRVAVKDVVAVAGHAVGAGNPVYLAGAEVAREHAPALEDLLRAGADVVGVARTDELAYSIAGVNAHTGAPPNGADPTRLPGGSTSGPASAVALGQADVALGTDTAGSLRVPASYQGLWGLRTTHGRVSRTGVLPLAPSFDTVGWLTRTGEELATVAAVGLAGWDAVGTPGGLAVPEEVLATLAPGTARAFAELLDLRLPPGWAAPARVSVGDPAPLREAFRLVQGAEAWRAHGDWVTAHPGALGPDVAARFEAAATVTPAQEEHARAVLAGAAERLRAVVDQHVLILPTTPGPAPRRGADPAEVERTRAATLATTCLAGCAGLPALSVPALLVDGAPVGVCLVGPAGSDLALVELGLALAAASHPEPTPSDPTKADAS